MTVGRSKITPYKQLDLRDLFFDQMRSVGAVFKKYEGKDWLEKAYYLFDITAGDMGLDKKTSPRIFLSKLLENEGFNFKVFLIEKNKTTFSELKKNVMNFIKEIPLIDERRYFRENVNCILGNNNKVLVRPEYLNGKHKWKYGLVYFDPNGFSYETWDLLSDFLGRWKALDVIMNLSAAANKRCINNPKTLMHQGKRISHFIDMIPKSKKFIRDCYSGDQHQFFMLFCTNWADYRICRNYDFIDLDTYEGQQILERLDQTKEEKCR